MSKKLKRMPSILLTIMMVFSFIFTSTEVFAANNDLLSLKKLYGRNRFETAVEVSKDGWGYSNYVIIANGYGFADALCSAPLSRIVDAPLLLTETNSMPTTTKREIERLGARKAYIVGGSGVVSSGIESQLKSMGLTVTRLAGRDRYETSVAVANEIKRNTAIKDVVIASGEEVSQGVDALSIAPIAGEAKMPIILSKKSSLTTSAINWIKSNHIHVSYVIGGSGVLSDTVYKQASNSKRIYGRNRYETNLQILEEFANYIDFEKVYLAKGEQAAVIDALTSGPIAAKEGNPLVLINDGVEPSLQNFLQKYAPSKLVAIGGQVANDTVFQVGRVLNSEIATGISKVTINDKRRITVDFNGVLNGYQASKIENYIICGSMVQSATIQPNYRTVVLRLKYDLDKSALLNFEGEAKNILGINMDVVFNKGNTNIVDNVTDLDRPRVTSVETLDTVDEGGNKILVRFSEKVLEADVRRISNYKIRRTDGTYVTIKDVKFDVENEDQATLYTESLDYAGRYLVEISGIRDLAENTMEPFSEYLDIFDTGSLKVIEYNARAGTYYNSKKIDIIFNKKLDKISATQQRNYTLLDAQGKPINGAVGSIDFDEDSRDRVVVEVINLKYDGDYTLEIAGITDLSGNNLARTPLELRNLIVEKPKITETPYVRRDTDLTRRQVILTFNQELNSGDAADILNYSLSYAGGGILNTNIEDARYSYDGSKSTVTLYLSNVNIGKHSLNVSGIRNKGGYQMDPTTVEFEIVQ